MSSKRVEIFLQTQLFSSMLKRMKSHCFAVYQREREKLTAQEIDHLLMAGRIWDFTPCLKQQGVVIFPHTYLHVCGAHTAACVHAALDSGADTVLAIGVLHSLTDEMLEARKKEREQRDVSHAVFRGIHGPDLSTDNYWQAEYSLLNFEFLWQEEVKRRSLRHPPKLILRYPYLTNRKPELLKGIIELQEIAKSAVIVATADFCHHGVAYGDAEQMAVPFGPAAHQFARKNIEKHLQVLETGDYNAYYQHCYSIRSDAYDVGTVIRYLRGPLSWKIHDLVIGDTSALFEGHPTPSWVAASLVSLEKKNVQDGH